ncbi:hypothetical protein [Nocardia transvalensis]|uniref:hypothetical protein n=1 Tax=Nocardia transvalensis TaxID=37333 RepID=UPI0018954399|nr:hypothetical protein [Nocardia transvalensis]MBF6328475.1 hypothetical protein [Nocardia transvalensis]
MRTRACPNRRLLELAAEKARLEGQVKDLDAQIARSEATVKIAIGTAQGIAGIATWTMGEGRGATTIQRRTGQGRRSGLYDSYVEPQFDAGKFKADRGAKEYNLYMESEIIRKFQLIDDTNQEN